MMADGLHCLLEHPSQQRLLAENPGLARRAVDEMLRFATPVLHSLPRVALEDVTLPSGTIAKGDLVLALIASAARDPKAVERPDDFDITRTPNPHIAFGVGEHYCLGANLAWAEAESTFTLLAQEQMLATMRIDGPVRWKEHHIVRGLEALPVAW
jgi:cytochrome P450